MAEKLLNCWEILLCGREVGGENAHELGVCPAAEQDFGHSCWAIAGTLCGGEIQGSTAIKQNDCMMCKVYLLYNRTCGIYGADISKLYADEHKRYNRMLRQKLFAMNP